MLVLIGFILLFAGGLVDLILANFFKLDFSPDKDNSMDMGSSPGGYVQILGVILMLVGLFIY